MSTIPRSCALNCLIFALRDSADALVERLTEGLEISETTYQANGWEKARRIVMVRQDIEKRPKAAGKQIKQLELFEDEQDFGKYRYSCFVTDLDLPAKIVYDSYRGRADSENRIKELKNDFSIDDFITNNFWATEACGNFIVMAYNFMWKPIYIS